MSELHSPPNLESVPAKSLQLSIPSNHLSPLKSVVCRTPVQGAELQPSRTGHGSPDVSDGAHNLASSVHGARIRKPDSACAVASWVIIPTAGSECSRRGQDLSNPHFPDSLATVVSGASGNSSQEVK